MKGRKVFSKGKLLLKTAVFTLPLSLALYGCGGGSGTLFDLNTEQTENNPPQVELLYNGTAVNPDQTLIVNLGEEVVLDIYATDPDGDNVEIASCELLQVDGSVVQKTYSLDCQNGKIVLDPLAVDPNIDPAKDYKLSVIVKDDKGATSEAVISVDINALPEIEFNTDKDLNDLWEGDDLTVNIISSDADGDEVVLTCEVNGQPVDCSDGTLTFTNLQPGVYEVRIIADDGKGGISENSFSFEVLANPTLTFEGVGNVADIQYTDTTIYVYGESASQGVTIRVNLSSGGYIEINGNIYYDGDLISIWDRSFDGATIYIYNGRGDLVDQKILDIGYV